jgi:L-2-hydroxycarboxylate dehydrogenase (NAD+)
MPERSVGKGIDHFFGAMQIDGFIDKDEFKNKSTNGLKSSATPSPRRAPTVL